MKILTKEQQADLLIQVGLAKLFNDVSTRLIGELKGEEKYWFKISINASDNLIKLVEQRMSPENLVTYELLNEALNDGIVNLRNELLTTIN